MKVSYNQLCEMTGFTYRTIKKRIDGIEPVGVTRTKANLWESTEVLPAIYAYNGTAGGDNKKADSCLSVNDERARLAKAQADGQELKNAQLRRELIPVSETVNLWGRIITAAKRQLLALPDRLSQILETTTTVEERRAVIDREIRIVLESLSKDESP